jgi:hypothetical protein
MTAVTRSLAHTTRIHALLALAAFLSGLVASPAPAEPPILSDLTYLPGDDTPAPAAGKQLNPEIATGNTTSLLVWVDDRAAITELASFSGGPYFDHHIGSSWDIYATRLDSAGHPLEAFPIIVTQVVQNQGMPDVAWNGSDWLVIWSGQTGLQCCPEVGRYAARISEDGALLDPTPITLATGSFGSADWPAAVGSDGTNWLVVWTTSGNQVVGMRVAPDGTVLDPTGVVLYTGGAPGDYDITFANGEYLVVWSAGGQTSGGAVLARRFHPDLTPVAPAFQINLYSPSVGRRCQVATNGTDYFAAWWEDRYYGWSQLVGARFSATGVVLDPDGLPLTEAYGYTNYEPAVTWDGVNYVVVYDRYAFPPIDLFATRVTPGGIVLDYDTSAIPVSTAPDRQWEAAAGRVPGGDGTLAVWRDARNSGSGYGDLYDRVIATGGEVAPETCPALGAPRQTRLKLVPDGTGYLAVYLSETGTASRVLAQRLDAAGAAINPEPIEVASGGAEIRSPSAAWNGTGYLVVWEDQTLRQIYARRYSSDLAALDAAPIAVMSGNEPDAAAVGEVFLVTCSFEDPPEVQRVYSRRLRGSDGALLDPAAVVIGGSFARHPHVAAFADRWIATWQRHPTHDDPNSTVRGNIVLATGLPQGEFSIDTVGEFPAVTVGGDVALVVWDKRNGPTVEDLDIYSRRILSGGASPDPAPVHVSAAVNAQFDAAVGWSGTEYVTAFGDFRNDYVYASKPGDLYAARVSEADVVEDPDGFVFSNQSVPEMYPAAAGGAGKFLLGGSVFRDATGYANYRIGLRRTLQPSSVPGSTAMNPLGSWRVQPNPFHSATTFSFDLPAAGTVRIEILDASGRRVRRLAAGALDAGAHEIGWDGRDEAGVPVSTGMYFAQIEAAGVEKTERLVRVR